MSAHAARASLALIACLLAAPSLAATAERAAFGTLEDGTAVERITLTNGKGVKARILSWGATLQALEAPDRQGRIADITLGHDDLQGYLQAPNYLGVTVGRYANRIAGGRFTLDGKAYQLPLNDKVNSLHGGEIGFDKKSWTVADVRSGPAASVTLKLTSPDGDQGYPGALDVSVTYTLDEAGALTIDFNASASAPTVVNMTNHAIFNLGGLPFARGIEDHRLTIPAGRFTPVNAALIPTGELAPVAGGPFDFRNGRRVGDDLRDGRDQQILFGRGYDHNFVLDAGQTKEPKLAARLEDPATGRVLEVLSTEPGVQVYSGNFLDGTFTGKGGQLYRMGDGIALEPQKFPDTPNQPAFGSARVEPGKPYHHRMIYRVSVAQ